MPFRFPPIVVRLLSFTARKRHSFSTNAVGGGAARATAAPLQRTVTDTDHTSLAKGRAQLKQNQKAVQQAQDFLGPPFSRHFES